MTGAQSYRRCKMVGGRWSKNTWFNPSVKTTTHISSPVHYSLSFDRFLWWFYFGQPKSVWTVYAALESKLSLACAFWHPGPWDLRGERGKEGGGWKTTRQYLLNPTSCWLLLTLSHQQHAVPPLRPIRPLGQQLSYASFLHLLPHVCSRWRQP